MGWFPGDMGELELKTAVPAFVRKRAESASMDYGKISLMKGHFPNEGWLDGGEADEAVPDPHNPNKLRRYRRGER